MDLHNDEHEDLREHLEHIPWSDLTVQRREFPRWAAYVAAGAIAVAALGVVAARSFGGGPTPTSAQEAVPVSATTVETVVTTLPAAAPLYSEADLMALVPGSQEQLASARAVWFVRDYFGSGGNPEEVSGVAGALPAGAVVHVEEEAGASYVEWAVPFSIEQLGDDLYDVGVVFGMLGGKNVSALARLQPKAVRVVVAVDADGVGVVDLPIPVELPSRAETAVWPDPSLDVPSTIIDAAQQEASMWGTAPEIVDASQGDAGWRVEVLVSDEAGIRWPMAVWIDGTEPTGTPPWDARR
jgi:hypothetical protein